MRANLLRVWAGIAATIALGCSASAEHGDERGGTASAGPPLGTAGETGTVGEAPSAPVCRGLSANLPDLACNCPFSSEPDCFEVSDDFKVCGLADAPEAGTCPDRPSPVRRDQCGCDGKTCEPGKSCRKITDTVSGGSFEENRCYAVCRSNDDCAAEQACVPNRFGVAVCVTPECRSDADCTEDACGHCVPERWMGFQGATWQGEPRCVYEGPASGTNCGGAGFFSSAGQRGPAYQDAHICHAWPSFGAD